MWADALTKCLPAGPLERFRKGIGLYSEKKETQGGENDLREAVVKGVAAVAVGGTLLSMRRLAGGPPEMGEIGGALLAGGRMVLVNQVKSVGIQKETGGKTGEFVLVGIRGIQPYGVLYRELFGKVKPEPYGVLYRELFGKVKPEPYGVLYRELFGKVKPEPYGVLYLELFGMVELEPYGDFVLEHHER
ncbi:unnamed protein product, partial [Effrenium voratum]